MKIRTRAEKLAEHFPPPPPIRAQLRDDTHRSHVTVTARQLGDEPGANVIIAMESSSGHVFELSLPPEFALRLADDILCCCDTPAGLAS